MALKRRSKRVEPMDRTDEIFKRVGGRDVLDAQRNDGNTLAYGPLNFSANLWRVVGVRRKDEDQDSRMVMASMMALPHSSPGVMSRGAIQHRTPDASSAAQVASAVALSRTE
jgi:hypothetical protein